MTTLGNVVKTVGPGVVRVVTASAGLDVAVARVILLDSLEQPVVRKGDIVLLLGLSPAAASVEPILSRISRAGAAAVVAKSGTADLISESANVLAVNVLAIPDAADWAQALFLLSSAISNRRFEASDDPSLTDDAGELFAVANLVADQLGAPITIEDAHSRLLAFSSQQEGADAPRIAAILGRSIPQMYMEMLKERGVLRRLLRQRAPIFIEELGPNTKPRAVVAIRAGGEVIGSMWALLSAPLTEDQAKDMERAADFVALHVLRHRLLGDLQARVESELVATALQGGTQCHEAVKRLQLHGPRFRVLACCVHTDDQAPEALIEKVRELLQFQLSMMSHGSRSVILNETVYALAPVTPNSLSSLKGTVNRFVARAASTLGTRVHVGIGAEVLDPSEISDSRFSADQVVRVLSSTPELGAAAAIEDVRWRVLMMRFAETCRNDLSLAAGPIEAIRDYDARRHTNFYQTLCAFLDAFGNIHAAATKLNVHPNTVRYRLRQMAEISNFNLDDPAERLGLMLELAISSKERGVGTQAADALTDQVVG